jgi:hypothetical protein
MIKLTKMIQIHNFITKTCNLQKPKQNIKKFDKHKKIRKILL